MYVTYLNKAYGRQETALLRPRLCRRLYRASRDGKMRLRGPIRYAEPQVAPHVRKWRVAVRDGCGCRGRRAAWCGSCKGIGAHRGEETTRVHSIASVAAEAFPELAVVV